MREGKKPIGMKLPNLWAIGGAWFVFVGVGVTVVGISGGGLAGSAGAFGATLPSVMSIVLGLVLLKIGERPERLHRR